MKNANKTLKYIRTKNIIGTHNFFKVVSIDISENLSGVDANKRKYIGYEKRKHPM